MSLLLDDLSPRAVDPILGDAIINVKFSIRVALHQVVAPFAGAFEAFELADIPRPLHRLRRDRLLDGLGNGILP